MVQEHHQIQEQQLVLVHVQHQIVHQLLVIYLKHGEYVLLQLVEVHIHLEHVQIQ